MSSGRWPANSYDEARDVLVSMLRTYRLERRNLEQEKRLVQEAIASLGGARTSNLDQTRIQMLHGDDAMVQRIERIAAERRVLDNELERIGEREKRLNTLLCAIGALVPFERYIIIGYYIDGTRTKSLAESVRKSEDTIVRHRGNALQKLLRNLFWVPDNSVRIEEERT